MNLETFKELLLKQQSSGLTVRAFCEQEHLSMSNWCYWKRMCATPMQNALVPMQLQHNFLGKDYESVPASVNPYASERGCQLKHNRREAIASRLSVF